MITKKSLVNKYMNRVQVQNVIARLDKRNLDKPEYAALERVYKKCLTNDTEFIYVDAIECNALQELIEKNILKQFDKITRKCVEALQLDIKQLKSETQKREISEYRQLIWKVGMTKIEQNTVILKSTVMEVLGYYFNRKRITVNHGLNLVDNVNYLTNRYNNMMKLFN